MLNIEIHFMCHSNIWSRMVDFLLISITFTLQCKPSTVYSGWNFFFFCSVWIQFGGFARSTARISSALFGEIIEFLDKFHCLKSCTCSLSFFLTLTLKLGQCSPQVIPKQRSSMIHNGPCLLLTSKLYWIPSHSHKNILTNTHIHT